MSYVKTIAILLFAAPVARGQTILNTLDKRMITVAAEAEVRVSPDQVMIALGVETFDKQLDKAQRQNDERVRRVLQVAQDQGVGDDGLKTDYLQIQPLFEYTKGGQRRGKPAGFQVRKSVVITLKDLSKFEALLSSVLAAGANYVHGVAFGSSELQEHRRAAELTALESARERATRLAGALERKIGGPLNIQETRWRERNWYSGSWGSVPYVHSSSSSEVGGRDASAVASVAPGLITVTARVQVTFELVE
ncbi:MAG: SIMPL domain-containing protein [Phycisphaerae bacterium]